MRPRAWRSAVALSAVLCVALHEAGCRANQDSDAEQGADQQPIMRAETVLVRASRMDRSQTLFGTVSPLSSTLHVYSLPFEARIDRLYVADGQHVAGDVPLFDSSRGLTARVAAEAATDLLREAEQSLAQVKARAADGLATREEVIRAEGQARRAEQQVGAMRQSGQLDDRLTTRASMAGVVAITGSPLGAMMPPGTAILGVAEDASIGALLWAEPSGAASIRTGMTVALVPLSRRPSTSLAGRVLRVDDRVDTATRMVRVAVVLDDPGSLILGESVRGRIALEPVDGLVVPRAALVPTDGRLQVFTVEDGRAHARSVEVIVDGPEEALVRGDHIDEGSRVITRGAYQAEEGLRVEWGP